MYGSTGVEAFNLTGQNFNYGANGPGNSFSVCLSENLSFTPFLPFGFASTIFGHSWTISGSYTTVGSLDQASLDVTSASAPYNNFSFTYQYQNACGWSPLHYGNAGTIDCAGGQEPFRVKFDKGSVETDSSLITGISMYPNPVRDRLIISLDKRIAGIKIIRLVDATGRSISSQQITGHTSTINFSGLANGIYYVEINQGKKRFIRKVIK
ncbi:MAG: T9SS type A sorting domain-containing protein [Chitinophagaceae bacterium]|nr:T9SS type A sorting domain-containing protein [Chitinophagaceae bacterium]